MPADDDHKRRPPALCTSQRGRAASTPQLPLGRAGWWRAAGCGVHGGVRVVVAKRRANTHQEGSAPPLLTNKHKHHFFLFAFSHWRAAVAAGCWQHERRTCIAHHAPARPEGGRGGSARSKSSTSQPRATSKRAQQAAGWAEERKWRAGGFLGGWRGPRLVLRLLVAAPACSLCLAVYELRAAEERRAHGEGGGGCWAGGAGGRRAVGAAGGWGRGGWLLRARVVRGWAVRCRPGGAWWWWLAGGGGGEPMRGGPAGGAWPRSERRDRSTRPSTVVRGRAEVLQCVVRTTVVRTSK